MNLSKSELLPTFFDDPTKPPHIWLKPLQSDTFKPGISNIFFKKKSKLNNYKPRYYTLSKEFLYYRKEENTPLVIKMMYFENLKLSILLKTENNSMIYDFGFKFVKNNHFSEIYTNDIEIFEKWKSIFSLKCILSTFHDDFEVKKMIGKGSFAKVYMATKKTTGKDYAVKAFSKEFLLSQNKGPESLRNEVNLMRRLSHKNILTLHEVHETKHSIYLIMEVLRGGELLKKIKEKRFMDGIEISRVMRNFFEALAHIHENGIMHRDLKPENLLLRDEYDISEIVVADFGLATYVELPITEILFKRCGTPGFVAPEILAYKDGQETFYDEKCDIFSAGVIFHILLTGKKPFPGADYKEILRANRTCSIDFNAAIFNSVDHIALDLLRRLLSADPSKRYTAIQALEHPFLLLSQPNENLLKPLMKISSGGLSLSNTPGELSKESLGSLSLVTRKPAFNGRVDTLEKLSQNNLNSAGNIDIQGCMTPKQKQISKFSNNPNIGGHIMGAGGIEEVYSPKKKGQQYFHDDLHKKAIINNLNKKEYEEEKKLN